MDKHISATFYSHLDFRKNGTIVDVYLQSLKMGDDYKPILYYLSGLTRNRYIKLKESLIKPSLLRATEDYDNLGFGFLRENDGYYHLEISLRSFDGFNKYGRPANPNICRVVFSESYFQSESFVEHYLKNLIGSYEMISPFWGKAHELDDGLMILDRKKWNDVYGKPAFYMIYWANFYGPETVEKNGGKDKFLNAPCWRVEELSDGGIMLILYPSPLNPASPEKRTIQNRVLEYFGLEPIDDSKLREL
jgi:hypothetical protein